jgi:hypothetical protein
MTETDTDELFRSLADAFIDKANELAQSGDTILVSTAMLYATSRFCAFTVAGQAEDLNQYKEDMEPAVDYYLAELKRMLGENLEQYQSAFEAPGKYDHLMKK